MTLILELHLDTVKIYLHTKNEVSKCSTRDLSQGMYITFAYAIANKVEGDITRKRLLLKVVLSNCLVYPMVRCTHIVSSYCFSLKLWSAKCNVQYSCINLKRLTITSENSLKNSKMHQYHATIL